VMKGQKLATRPDPAATGCWIVGLLIAWRSMSGSFPSEIAARAALVVGGTLVIAVGLEVVKNRRAALRPDIGAFFALYFFTFFEFLFPQPDVDRMVTSDSITYGCILCFIAFGTLAIARHWAPPAPSWLGSLFQRPSSPKTLLLIFWICFFLGYFYMLLAVNFNLAAMLDWMLAPRYTQPWSRARYGDLNALWGEVGKIVNLVPPIAGLILAKREKYRPVAYIPVILALLFCIFEGFTSGTRNILAIYLVTFLVGYGVNLTRRRLIEFLVFCGLAAVGFYLATQVMLTTRLIGLKEYFSQEQAEALAPPVENSVFIDLDLVNISRLTEKFPAAHPFLGFELPYYFLLHPLPRALWPGKPEGLSMPIETALGVYDGSETLTTTFVGEAYIAGGVLGVVLAAIFFGMATSWWGRFASARCSEFGFLIYASGFIAITISMRTMFELTVAVLPTIAAIVLGLTLLRKPKALIAEAASTCSQIPMHYERL
jgi:oligosaccharide repeat unit polymerase